MVRCTGVGMAVSAKDRDGERDSDTGEDRDKRQMYAPPFLSADHPVARQVAFVPYEQFTGVFSGVAIDLYKPVCHVPLAVFVGDIVYDHYTVRSSVVGAGYGAVFLLPRSVPYL